MKHFAAVLVCLFLSASTGYTVDLPCELVAHGGGLNSCGCHFN